MADCRKPRDPSDLHLRKKYRGHFDIIALILEAAKYDSASRFSIMSFAKINCSQLKKYLKSITEMGFVDTGVKAGHFLYKTNDRGLSFLRQYYVLLGMLLSARTSKRMANRVVEAQTIMNHISA